MIKLIRKSVMLPMLNLVECFYLSKKNNHLEENDFQMQNIYMKDYLY